MSNTNTDFTKTSSMTPETLAAMCYAPLVGWIAAIVVLIINTKKETKWHAVQGLLVMAVIWAAGWVLGSTWILALFSPLVWVAGIILGLVLVVKTNQGEKVRLPFLAPLTDKIMAEKISK